MKIQGNLATYEFSDLLQWLAQGNKTGVLTVTDGGVEYQLGFDHGRIDMSSSSDPTQRLERYLHGKGVIDEATLARADRLREATKMMSGQVLVTLGAVTELQLAQALREKTEEILCELLTWDQGTFEFEGGERPAATMVPISLEVTKLLLESMHKLDQQRGGPQSLPAPPPAAPREETSSVVDEPAPGPKPPPAADATQAIEGLSLAEVLDPESPAQPAPAADPAPEEMPFNYAAMAEAPGPLRRYAPYALVAVLSLSAIVFYLVDRGASAQAADAGPTGEPILFTRTAWPPRTADLAPAPEAVAEVDPGTAPQPQVAAAAGDDEETLRRRYEEELASLRAELAEARRQVPPAPPRAASQPTASELPADSIMRAAVSRSEPEPAAAAAAEPDRAPAPSPAAVETTAAPAAEPAVAATPPPAALPAAEPEPAVAEPVTRQLELVNPRLLSRPAPRYPAAARRHGRGASVIVRVLVAADGLVREVERVGPKAGMGFDRAAEEAALESRWESGTRNGEPVEMWAELRFEFKP